MGINPPCYECNRRALLCHERCDNYREWKNERQQLNNKRREYKRADGFAMGQGERWRKRPDSRIRKGRK